MATSNSSIGNNEEFELTGPGQRTGEGAGSVLPYLHESLASRPAELSPTDQPTKRTPARSLVDRVRRALLAIGKTKRKGDRRI